MARVRRSGGKYDIVIAVAYVQDILSSPPGEKGVRVRSIGESALRGGNTSLLVRVVPLRDSAAAVTVPMHGALDRTEGAAAGAAEVGGVAGDLASAAGAALDPYRGRGPSPDGPATLFLDAAPTTRCPPLIILGTLALPVATYRYHTATAVHCVVASGMLTSVRADIADSMGETPTVEALKALPIVIPEVLPSSDAARVLIHEAFTALLSPPDACVPTTAPCGLCKKLFQLKKRMLWRHVALCVLVVAPALGKDNAWLATVCGCCGQSGTCKPSRRTDGTVELTGCAFKSRFERNVVDA